MPVNCGDCGRTFGTSQALQQHLRDSPVHAITYDCEDCHRNFNTEDALQQHLRDSPAHAIEYDCEDCDRTFNTEDALEQHLRDSPAHAIEYNCEDCDRAFNTEYALQQHLRDSPAHVVTYECDDCDRSFDTEDALQQHLRDSPAHVTTYDCNDCDRAFNTEDALQQHLRNSPAHAVRYECDDCDRAFNTEDAFQQHLQDSPAHIVYPATGISHSFSLHPSLHGDVLSALRIYNLTFDFYEVDDPHGSLKEQDTSIMGSFSCTNNACAATRWTSNQIAVTIRRYPGNRYNARVYFQRCKSCDSLSEPELDESYAERVSYRLAKWSGIAVEEPPYSGRSRRPHQSSLCEGCKHGHCRQSRL